METKHTELEEMRQQLGILKNKLENQTLINDKLIRQSMLNKMSFMKKYTWMSYFALAFIFIVFYFLREYLNMSWWLYGATLLFTTLDVACDAYINSFSKKEFLNGDLIATSRKMHRMKQLRKKALLIGVVISAIWIPWLIIETYNGLGVANGGENETLFYGLMVGGGVGLIIGAVIGISIYFRMQRINSDIIRQIDELTNEAEDSPTL